MNNGADGSCGVARRGAGGFTLIELLVVFALMALIVGLAPVAYQRLDEGARYRATLRAVIGDLRQARQLAQTGGREVRFVADVEQRKFGVEGAAFTDVAEPLELRAVTAADGSLARGQFAIRFLPQGGASGGSIDILRPSGTGTRTRVDWLTGRIEQESVAP